MVKLICYNIEYCEGLKGKWYGYFNFIKELFFPPKGLDQKMVDTLKEFNPDILGLVEVDIGSIRNRRKDEAQFFSEGLMMKSFDEAIKYSKKFFKLMPIMRKQGIALLSKYKTENIKHHVLSRGVKRIVIEATVHCPKKVTLLLAHLALGKRARKKQIHELVGIVNRINNPVILMGDFNTFKGEKEIQELLDETALKHKFKLRKNDVVFTQPSFKPSRTLDYVLTSNEVIVKDYKVLNLQFSDHLPLLVEFDVV